VLPPLLLNEAAQEELYNACTHAPATSGDNNEKQVLCWCY